MWLMTITAPPVRGTCSLPVTEKRSPSAANSTRASPRPGRKTGWATGQNLPLGGPLAVPWFVLGEEQCQVIGQIGADGVPQRFVNAVQHRVERAVGHYLGD